MGSQLSTEPEASSSSLGSTLDGVGEDINITGVVVCIQCSLTYLDPTYSEYSLTQAPVWEPIHIPYYKVIHLSGKSVLQTVSLEPETC